MKNKHRDLNTLQILDEVCLREDCDAVLRTLETARHSLAIPIPDQALTRCCILAVEAEEWAAGDIDEELGSVFHHGVSEAVEYFH